MRNASTVSVLVFALALVFAAGAGAQIPTLVINEFDSDQPGSDTTEFIELYDGGIGNQSLVGYCLVFFNGASAGDPSYFALDLTGSTDANGFYLVGNASVVPTPAQILGSNALQNGAGDAIGLYFAAASSFPNGTPATATNLQDAVVYSGTVDAALIGILTPGMPQVDENSSVLTAAGRCPDGSNGPLNTLTYTLIPPSPGASNTCPSTLYTIDITQPLGCGDNITISVQNAPAFVELYNLISLECVIPGTGPFFGLGIGPLSGDPLGQIFLPFGAHPFHVASDGLGAYLISVPTAPTCAITISVQAVSIAVNGFAIMAISEPMACSTISL